MAAATGLFRLGNLLCIFVLHESFKLRSSFWHPIFNIDFAYSDQFSLDLFLGGWLLEEWFFIHSACYNFLIYTRRMFVSIFSNKYKKYIWNFVYVDFFLMVKYVSAEGGRRGRDNQYQFQVVREYQMGDLPSK